MRYCMQYHNYEGESCLPVPTDDFAPFTELKSQIFTTRSFVQRHAGDWVFLILGIGKNPRRYYLWECFTIERVEPQEDAFIAGGPGFMLNPPQRLDGDAFHEFKEKCARFVSFKDISELAYTSELRRLAGEFHRPGVIDEKTRAFCDELTELIPEDIDADYIKTYVDEELDESAPEDESEDDELVETLPLEDEDEEIERVTRLIIARQGQAAFREMLIEAYDGKCAITGCNAIPALEAAHIKPHTGPHSNIVANGLLLRSDIHSLFDQGLILVQPDTLRVTIHPDLQGTSYQELDGIPVYLPEDPADHPDRDLLQHRLQLYNDEPESGSGEQPDLN